MTKRHFVKYKNRKLHEIGERNPYVRMEQLQEIVAAGNPVEIRDDETGEDVTAFVLARLVYEHTRTDHEAYTTENLRKLIMTARRRRAEAA